MSKFQGQKGVAHIITEIITEEEYCDVNDKHKYVKEQLGRKLSTINSPTESVKSTHSSKPFESPKKHGFKKPTFFIDNSDFLTDEVREYDYIEVCWPLIVLDQEIREEHQRYIRAGVQDGGQEDCGADFKA